MVGLGEWNSELQGNRERTTAEHKKDGKMVKMKKLFFWTKKSGSLVFLPSRNDEVWTAFTKSPS